MLNITQHFVSFTVRLHAYWNHSVSAVVIDCIRGSSGLPYMNQGPGSATMSSRSQRTNLTMSTLINNYMVRLHLRVCRLSKRSSPGMVTLKSLFVALFMAVMKCLSVGNYLITVSASQLVVSWLILRCNIRHYDT